MSDLEISTEHPRPLSSEVLRESLRRPTRFLVIFAAAGVIAAMNAMIVSPTGTFDELWSIGWSVCALGSVMLAVRAAARRATLKRLWRDGHSVEVRCRRSFHLWTLAYACLIETEGGRTWVILSEAPAHDAVLAALVLDRSIAVRDFSGRLRGGRLR